MAAMYWYYFDHENDKLYWCYSGEMSNTDFAEKVSKLTGKSLTASDTSYADRTKDLDRHKGYGVEEIHVES